MLTVCVPCFIKLYSNCKGKFREIILDHFFIKGPIVLLKAMIIICQKREKQFLAAQDQQQIIQAFDEVFSTDVIDPVFFGNELLAPLHHGDSRTTPRI